MRRLFSSVLVALFSTSVQAATLQFQIADSPPDAFKLKGGLSGHTISAALTGGFSITTEPGQSARVHDFDLRLTNVTENFDLPNFDVEDYENAPLQDFLPLDIESLPSHPATTSTWLYFVPAEYFEPFNTVEVIPRSPTTAMLVTITGNTAAVYLSARLTDMFVLDGPGLLFEPLSARVIPEPSAIAVASGCLLGLAVGRRSPIWSAARPSRQ
jgi:hypothetical protein